MNAPRVDADGRHVRALVVAFGEAEVAERGPQGIAVFRERWDAQSVDLPTARVRMLRSHDRTRPVGWWETFTVQRDGIWADGSLVGGAAELEHMRALIGAGLMADVSIGFIDSPKDQWSRPTTRHGLATVLRRGVRLREVSLVDLAGVPGSRVLSITTQPPGLSPASLEVLAQAHARPSPAVAAAVVARQSQAAQAEGRTRPPTPPAPPPSAAVLAEARALVAARERWRPAEPEPAAVTVLATRQRQEPSTWSQRWNALIDSQPDYREDPLGFDATQRALLALLNEPHDD